MKGGDFMILVHKGSLGILDKMPWDGSSYTFQGKKVERYSLLNRDNIARLGLNLDEWWIVDEKLHSTLAYKLKLFYPFFDPIVDENGELVDIEKWDKYRIYGEKPPKEELTPEQAKQKRRRGRKMTSLKLW